MNERTKKIETTLNMVDRTTEYRELTLKLNYVSLSLEEDLYHDS